LAKNRNSEAGRVSWYFAAHETDIAARLRGCLERVSGVDVGPRTDRIINFHFYSLQWARLLAEFGKRDQKHLPAKYRCSNPDYLRGLFDGLVDSDGHVA